MTESTGQKLLHSNLGLGTWVLDPEASTIRLTHKTMWGMSTVSGEFSGMSGEGTIGPGGQVNGTLTIQAASLDTKHPKRDKHLRSDAFFDVENHPEITVRVLSADSSGQDVELDTEVEVKGIRERMPLTSRVRQTAPDAVSVATTATLDRSRFGMNWNQLGMIRGPATITVNAVFTHAPSSDG
jgi:polyisoprenoid-binding protein YceI